MTTTYIQTENVYVLLWNSAMGWRILYLGCCIWYLIAYQLIRPGPKLQLNIEYPSVFGSMLMNCTLRAIIEFICNVRRKKDCKIWSAWKVIKDRPKVYPVTTSKSICLNSWNTNLTNACNTVSMFPTIIFHPTCQCLDV